MHGRTDIEIEMGSRVAEAFALTYRDRIPVKERGCSGEGANGRDPPISRVQKRPLTIGFADGSPSMLRGRVGHARPENLTDCAFESCAHWGLAMLQDGLDHRIQISQAVRAARFLADIGAGIGNPAGNPFGPRAMGVIAEKKRGRRDLRPVMFLYRPAEQFENVVIGDVCGILSVQKVDPRFRQRSILANSVAASAIG